MLPSNSPFQGKVSEKCMGILRPFNDSRKNQQHPAGFKLRASSSPCLCTHQCAITSPIYIQYTNMQYIVYSHINKVFGLKDMCEKYQGKGRDLCIAFMDPEKVYDKTNEKRL